jgi:hypothetical protein
VKQTPRYFDVATELTADHENDDDDEDDSRGMPHSGRRTKRALNLAPFDPDSSSFDLWFTSSRRHDGTFLALSDPDIFS